MRFNVFRAFLQYLYTDKIDLPAEEAVGKKGMIGIELLEHVQDICSIFFVFIRIDLLKLANYYCEVKLRNQCEVLIKQSITIENAARLYSSAIQYNAKVRKL